MPKADPSRPYRDPLFISWDVRAFCKRHTHDVSTAARAIGLSPNSLGQQALAGHTSLTIFKALHERFAPDQPIDLERLVVRRGKGASARFGPAVRQAAIEFDRRRALTFRLDDGALIKPHADQPDLSPAEVAPPPARPQVAASPPRPLHEVVAAIAAERGLDAGRLGAVVSHLRDRYTRDAIHRHYKWGSDEEFETYMDAAYQIRPPRAKFAPPPPDLEEVPLHPPQACVLEPEDVTIPGAARPTSDESEEALDVLVRVVASVQNKRNLLAYKLGELTARNAELERQLASAVQQRDAALQDAEAYKKLAAEAFELADDPVLALTRAGATPSTPAVARVEAAAARARATGALRDEIAALGGGVPNF